MPIFNLPFYRYLDQLNNLLTQAISVARPVNFSADELAWFRRPVTQ